MNDPHNLYGWEHFPHPDTMDGISFEIGIVLKAGNFLDGKVGVEYVDTQGEQHEIQFMLPITADLHGLIHQEGGVTDRHYEWQLIFMWPKDAVATAPVLNLAEGVEIDIYKWNYRLATQQELSDRLIIIERFKP